MDGDVNVLMIVANKDFRDEEYNNIFEIFQQNGVGVKVAAEEIDECIGVGGTQISPDYTFDEINVDQYDGIVYIGGIGAEQYFTNDLALQLPRDFTRDGKLVGAISWSAVVLARAGLLKGKKATVSENGIKDLNAVGAQYTGELVTIDGNIVTASGPDAANQFAQTIADILLKQ